MGDLLRGRLERSRELLLSELRDGAAALSEVGEVDEIAAVIFRYARAATEGSARLNLRLMAKVIDGQVQGGTIYPDEFLRYAEIIASLSREEIVLIATLHKYRDHYDTTGEAQNAAVEDLVPTWFKDKEDFMAVAGAATRTGLVIGASAIGTLVYKTSVHMDRLHALAPFEQALEQEPREQ